MNTSFLRLQCYMVVGTILLFVTLNGANEWLFLRFEFSNGINWFFLPAGMRLLCTLLFGTAGTIGLLISGLLLNFYHFSFDTPMRALFGAAAGAIGPYLVYRYAEYAYGLKASLANLTPKRLLLLSVVCSVASPLFHHIWFALSGSTDNLLRSFFVMFIGDLNGTLIVIYTMKGLLALLQKRNDGVSE